MIGLRLQGAMPQVGLPTLYRLHTLCTLLHASMANCFYAQVQPSVACQVLPSKPNAPWVEDPQHALQMSGRQGCISTPIPAQPPPQACFSGNMHKYTLTRQSASRLVWQRLVPSLRG